MRLIQWIKSRAERDKNYQVYGARKAWHHLKREGFTLARCTVDRLIKHKGIRGAVRGKVLKRVSSTK